MMTKPFDVLDKNQKIFGNYFIEASAGTGKTFTIAHLVLRLLLQSTPPISIKKMGIVTFTKAAASELKKRIKELLKETKDQLENNLPIKIFGLDLDHKEALFRIKMALTEIDSAPISTLHGLCFHILKKNALELNLPLSLLEPEESNLDFKAFTFIKTHLQNRSLDYLVCKKQKALLLSNKRGDFTQMILSLRQKILSAIEIEPLENWHRQEQALKTGLEKLPPYPGLEEIKDYILRYKLSPLTLEEFTEQLEVFDKVMTGKEPLENLLLKKCFLQFIDESRLKQKALPVSSLQAEKFIQKAILELHPLIDLAMDPDRIELVIAKSLKELFDKKLLEENILSFNSLLTTLDKNLIQSSTIQNINKSFEAIIVDEFQDTDPVQWSILKKLFVDIPVKAFYMVGDPKQAIYAFRSADVYTYIEAKNTCPDLSLGTLNTCFRSSNSFIKALNRFLCRTPWIDLSYISQSLPYNPVCSSSINCLQKENPFSFYSLKLDVENTEQKMANLALSLLEINKAKTVAILVKDRFQLQRVENFLKLSGASCDLIKNETLDQSVLYELFSEFLSLLEDPLTKSSLNRFMASGWFSLTVLDFSKQTYELHLNGWQENLKIIKQSFEDFGLFAALENALDCVFGLCENSLRVELSSYYGLDCVDKLFSLASCLDARVQGIQSPQNFQLELEKLKKSNHLLPTVSLNKNSIYLMTSHMSKGLEFDHVIALGICTRIESEIKTVIKRSGNKLILGPNTKEESSMLALCDLDAEKLRQMYVAITRAKMCVHIPLINYEDSPIEWGALSPFEYYLLKIEFPHLEYKEQYNKACGLDFSVLIKKHFEEEGFNFIASIEPPSASLKTQHLSYLDKTLPITKIYKENHLSFSSLKTESVSLKTEDPLKGRDYGDFFHMLMEMILKSGDYRHFENQKTQDFIAELISLSPFKDFKMEVLSHIENAISFEFKTRSSQFTLKTINPSNLYVEEAFSYLTPDGTMKGFIDCVVVFDQELIFIDWKTTFLNDLTSEGIKEHMKKASYLLQLDLYTKALIHLKSYFKNLELSKAFYVFVKQGVAYEASIEEGSCLV